MEIVRVGQIGVDAAAAKAAAVVAEGGIIVYPTDTLYGIGVNALDTAALARLTGLKGREAGKPYSMLVPDTESMEQYGGMTDAARKLAEKFLPGALTLVIPSKENVPKEMTLDGNVSFRIPDNAFTHALSMMSEFPVTSTSANLAGKPTPATIPEIIMQFGSRIKGIDLFIDDGPRAGGTPSTVILCVGDTPKILREGAISRETLGLQ
jgi:L-threonylcarbamoyladenylate synthase